MTGDEAARGYRWTPEALLASIAEDAEAGRYSLRDLRAWLERARLPTQVKPS